MSRVVGVAAPRLFKNTGYIKTSTREDRMNFVTINNLWLKCYLKFYKIVADRMRGFNTLAIALNDIYCFLEKNINENVYSFLATLIFMSLSSTNICQRILSLSDKFNALTISTGIVVLNDLECAVCKFAVDSSSNSFIPPFMLFLVNIYDNIL